ncbi:MmgE/PrpD family protein [Dactylosporangium sp. AC04546]|uniref:MmgE/PrpD family protein n=1 Tax=Dactylosporangium sp. AC04546 TaxID=2862460 RepID=UPI001EE0E37D|nr:MmgE/PrpD family protein [Dactylosporangium sp. AC04546]WVK81458.1 MmgE/PrpD family protein [Dactylosporangium sp. AC04546]
MTVARRLAEWGLSETLVDLPPAVADATRRHVLDGLGTLTAALRRDAATPAITVALGLGGPPEARLFGTGRRVGAAAAALAGGALVHALDFDDTHAGGLVHATAPVLPVVLALSDPGGEHEGEPGGEPGRENRRENGRVTGAEALAATAVGLETVCRLGAAAPHAFHARGLHATAACGVIAAALTAARLLRLDPAATTDALGIAASQAGGLLEFLHTGSSTKQLHPGLAAHHGILAARLAAAGASGPASAIEGAYGLFAALADRRVTPDAVLDGLGERWELTRITIKPYPACQLLHAPLDAAARIAVGPDAVELVEVEVHPDAEAIVCGPDQAAPRTAYQAKFALAWCVAAMLYDGAVTLDTFDDVDRPEVRALAARVRHRVVAFPGPAAEQPGRVTVTTRDGRRRTGEVPRSGGGPDDPAIADLVRAKALANLGAAGPGVVAAVDRLAGAPDLTELLESLEAS